MFPGYDFNYNQMDKKAHQAINIPNSYIKLCLIDTIYGECLQILGIVLHQCRFSFVRLSKASRTSKSLNYSRILTTYLYNSSSYGYNVSLNSQ